MSKLALTPAKTKTLEPDLLLLPMLGNGTSQAKLYLLMTFVRPPHDLSLLCWLAIEGDISYFLLALLLLSSIYMMIKHFKLTTVDIATR